MSNTCTNPRTNGPLLASGVRAAVFVAGKDSYSKLSTLEPTKRLIDVEGKIARVTEMRLSCIDRLTERDLRSQADPQWRTPEGAEQGLINQYGDSFGRILTVIHFEIL